MKNILLLSVTLVMCFIVLEVIAAHFLPCCVTEVTFKGDRFDARSGLTLSQDPVLLYEPRNPPQPIGQANNDNSFRIIAAGDSITYLYNSPWSIKDYYPYLLQELLNENFPGLHFEVFNEGVTGYNTKQEVRYVETRLLAFSPDMVIVGYCSANDRAIKRRKAEDSSGVYLEDITESYPYIPIMPLGFDRFLLAKSALYRFLNFKFVAVAQRFQWNYFLKKVRSFSLSSETEAAIERMGYLARKNNFLLLFVIFPSLDNGSEEESDWVAGVCEKYKIDYVDLRPVFRKAGYDRLRINSGPDRIDITHPNKMGHFLAAQELCKYFQENPRLVTIIQQRLHSRQQEL